ncbi:MAG: hypothetical protein QNL33_17975 [Akkermansiaceae bacterium]
MPGRSIDRPGSSLGRLPNRSGQGIPYWVKAAGAHSQSLYLSETAAAYLNTAPRGPASFDKVSFQRKLPLDLRLVIFNTSGITGSYHIQDPEGSSNPYPFKWALSAPHRGKARSKEGAFQSVCRS